ncbi:hypothetical protein EC973_009416 [Apophysomyces ossiformis]|uniref:Uncharacterized protein n=1 Tax=Apophysomyces ossiformis TaxID=679940 RepID=A0A8H7BJT4_9FUNG|nr:hypothetical protein EC973_009416 [Apophysomyces ossiformis]
MEESTHLSRSFADQGLKIRIRKELRQRRRFNKRSESDGNSENVEDTESKPEKRLRKSSSEKTNSEFEQSTTLTLGPTAMTGNQIHNSDNLQTNAYSAAFQNVDGTQREQQQEQQQQRQISNEHSISVSYETSALYPLQPVFCKKIIQSPQALVEHVNGAENSITVQQSNAIAVETQESVGRHGYFSSSHQPSAMHSDIFNQPPTMTVSPIGDEHNYTYPHSSHRTYYAPLSNIPNITPNHLSSLNFEQVAETSQSLLLSRNPQYFNYDYQRSHPQRDFNTHSVQPNIRIEPGSNI